ncbi:MAG: hypothetical protein KDA50_00005 [Rhodobacteraceae bacterium]|nr:hypothetical protein [Paracoccaceae bacterium]
MLQQKVMQSQIVDQAPGKTGKFSQCVAGIPPPLQPAARQCGWHPPLHLGAGQIDE